LEKRGVATATIVTSGFVKSTQTHRRLLKQPDLPYSVVPHPIVSMSAHELNSSADAIFDEVASAVSRALSFSKTA
jgi:hypothetical protein